MNRTASRRFALLIVTATVLFMAIDARANDEKQEPAATSTSKHLVNPYANPKENPALPNVLLLGDSISIGYTIPVRKELQGKANVFRPATNCRYSSYGVKNLKLWLGNRHARAEPRGKTRWGHRPIQSSGREADEAARHRDRRSSRFRVAEAG
ncbi:MAG: hypothetical protein JW888_16225 [Pirellulales bacterium]|nr:hypothetical protein [Pirellulales bacterium]